MKYNLNYALFFALPLAIFPSSTLAQSIAYVIERDKVFITPDQPVGQTSGPGGTDNRSLVTVWGGYLSPANLATFENAVASAVNDDVSSRVSSLEAALASVSWFSVTQAAGLQGNIRDWNLLNAPLSTEGFRPVMLITTAESPSALSLTSRIGIVSSTRLVPEAGTFNVGFNTTPAWDNAILGNLDSITLTPIPEPRVYAAFLGFLALGFVAWRRRKCA